MANAQILPLHGGAMGALDMLIGLGPVILGGVLIGAFVVLLATDRSQAARSGYRDERPTGARLLFSGKYYELEELLRHEWTGYDAAGPRRPASPTPSPDTASPPSETTQAR